MQRLLILNALAVGALLASMPAHSQPAAYRAEATLTRPVVAPTEQTISGAVWRCWAEACTGAAPRKVNLAGPVRQCRKVATALGPVSSFRAGQLTLTQGQIRACNRAATEVTPPEP